MGRTRVTGLAEAFNLCNRKNDCNYVPRLDAARFGEPARAERNAYVPRSGQLGIRYRCGNGSCSIYEPRGQ